MTSPTLTGFGPTVSFTESTVNLAPQILDADVTFDDADGDLDGGTLSLSGILAEDTVSVNNEGTGSGQIGLSGADVTFEGVVIGTLAGGAGTDLTISFNAAATSAAIDALIQNLTYANSSATPTETRDFVLNVIDAAGNDLMVEPLFNELQGADNPFDGIDIGQYSAPAFGDLDGDGDLDLVVGEIYGSLIVFENEDGIYTQLTGDDNPFDGIDLGSFTTPSFVDLDDDGDQDLAVGENSGIVNYFENDGGTYTLATGPDRPFAGVDVGNKDVGDNSTPIFADWNGDGDLDLVVGEYDGTIKLFDNDNGVFTEITGSNNPLDGIDAGRFSAPGLVDYDSDGDLDLLVGNNDGDVKVFQNTSVAFVELVGEDNPLFGIDVGIDSTPTFVDLDGDGDLDMVVGNSDGELFAFENTAPRGETLTVNVTDEAEIPDIADLPTDVSVLEDTASDVDLSPTTLSDTNTSIAIAIQLVASAGLLEAASAGDVTVEGSGTGTLTLTGTVPDLDAYLNNATAIQYTGALNVFGDDAATLTLTTDNGAVELGVVNVDITDVADTQNGDDGPNVLVGDDGVDILNGNGGNDTITGAGGNDTIDGGADDDTINGNAGADSIDGGDGDDVINGGIGPDVIDGGVGDDTISGGDGFDTLNGGDGIDTIRGNAGNDAINGGAGDDTLIGGIGADTIDGGADNDTITGGDGFDTLSGGEGDDNLNGNAGNDTIFGGAGDDTLRGGIGFDTMSGEGGNDTLIGQEGADTLSGGAGMDTINGNAGSDQIDGGADDDFLEGGQGIDTILGGTGNDTLRGQTGSDTLMGEDGDDEVFGGEGADHIDGGAGDDVLTGGSGADDFVFNGGNDEITDYALIVDRLELDGVALEVVGLTGAEVVSQFGEIVDGDTVLTFLTGDVLTLTDITNSAAVLGSTIDVI